MDTLKQLFAKYKKGDWPDRDTIHSYVDVYQELLAPYRHTAKNILEIGLMNGESLRVWTEYFDGKVYGMDCSETPLQGMADLRPIMAEGKYNICIGDATSESDIEKYFKDVEFDLVIDDGNHLMASQLETFRLLKNKMANGSLYIIEDIQNIDAHRNVFENMEGGKEIEIIDRRHIKRRYDDVIVIIKF